MKYFSNIHNADELRKAYRAHVINLHPDRGGNEEEFKAMQAEFETLKQQYQNGTHREQYTHTETAEERARREQEEQREREEWARWEAEEKARREQEEREKAERIRKAQEENRAAVRAWAQILERVSVNKTGEKARYYRFDDKKQAAAFVAATKRNIQRVVNHYFPGQKVKVTISGEIWKEQFIISWEDGPSEKQLRDTCKELAFFLPACYHCADIGEDYGHYEENDSTAPWREAYGQALGDIDDYKTARTLSEEGKQQAEEFAARYFANFDPKSEADKFTANLQELINMAKAAGFYKDTKITNIFRQLTGNYYGDMYGACESITGEVNRHQLRKMFAEHIRVNVTPKAKAPEFIPTYGPTYKAIKKALGANVFYIDHRDSRKNEELTIFEAAERLAKGEAVQIGHKWDYEGETLLTGTDRGGYKTQQKRAQKFEAVGIILEGTSFHTHGNINALGIKAETLEALRREAEDIEKQREAWEAKQTANEGTQQPQERKKAAKTANRTSSESNAESILSAAESRERKATANADTTNTTANEGAQQPQERTTAAKTDNTPTDSQNRTSSESNAESILSAAESRERKATANADSERDTAPAEGLTLQDTAEGVAVIGNSRTTYKHRREIKAHGAKWNKQAQQWQATDPDDVARLRAWFALREVHTESTESTESAPAATLHEAGEITDTTDEPTVNEPQADQPGDLSPLMEALADVLRIFADIMQQAKQWEGVTIPAATLERWKQEANEGTKTAAARLCEVCACLACLTPDSRRDFDALGSIFWTLSEQLKNGYNPDNLQGATDYARAQLFDLIDRTQTANQARAIREVLTPDNEHRTAA